MDPQQPLPSEALSPLTSTNTQTQQLTRTPFSPTELEIASKVLAAIHHGGKDEADPALRKLRGQVFDIAQTSTKKKLALQAQLKQARKTHDRALLDSTAMRSSRLRRLIEARKQLPDSAKDALLIPDGATVDCGQPALETSPAIDDETDYKPKRRLHKPVMCYICKELFAMLSLFLLFC